MQIIHFPAVCCDDHGRIGNRGQAALHFPEFHPVSGIVQIIARQLHKEHWKTGIIPFFPPVRRKPRKISRIGSGLICIHFTLIPADSPDREIMERSGHRLIHPQGHTFEKRLFLQGLHHRAPAVFPAA